MSRQDRIRTLLETANDYIRDTDRHELPSQPGPAPDKWAPCPTCGRTGRILTVNRSTRQKRWKLCPDCTGGWRKAKAGDEPADPYVYEYDHDPTRQRNLGPPAETLTSWDRRLTADLERLAATQAEREGRLDQLPYRDPRDTLDRTGSYRQLRQLLDRMHNDEPLLRDALVAVYEDRTPAAGKLGALEATAISWLDQRMPKRILLPARLERERTMRAERAPSVRTLADLGLSRRQIARRLRLDLRVVKRALAVA